MREVLAQLDPAWLRGLGAGAVLASVAWSLVGLLVAGGVALAWVLA